MKRIVVTGGSGRFGEHLKKKDNLGMPFDSSLNINKLNKILKK